MFSVASHYDVFVTASGTDATRRNAVTSLMAIYPLDGARANALARGERTLLRGEVSNNDAQRIATDLRALGLRVDLESREAAFEAVGLDGSSSYDDDAPRAAPVVDNPFFNVSAGLVGLDGEDDPADEPVRSAPAPARGGSLGLLGASLSDADEPLMRDESEAPRAPAATPAGLPRAKPKGPPPPPRMAPPRMAPPPVTAAVQKPAPIAVASTQRFRPTGDESLGLELKLDLPAPEESAFMTSGMSASAAAKPEGDVFEVPRCPTHDVPKPNGHCTLCDEQDRHLKSRFMGGKLRQQPAVRLGIGLGAGIFIGWLITSPMARHSEMKVQNVRDAAAHEHVRPTEEAQAHAAELDAQADELASDAFVHTFGTWALIAAAVTGVWMKLS